MASQTIQNPKTSKPRSPNSFFLACFGAPRELKLEKSDSNNNNNNKNNKKKKKKKKKDIASWSKIVMKNVNKKGSKTVPIDHQNGADFQRQDGGSDSVSDVHTTNTKSSKKSSKMGWLDSYRLFKRRDQKIQSRLVMSSERKSFDHEAPRVAKLLQGPKENPEVRQNGAVQGRELSDDVVDSGKEEGCGGDQKRSLRTRRSVTGLGQVQLGSPKPNRASVLPHSVSMPPPAASNVDAPSRSLVKAKTFRQNNNNNHAAAGKGAGAEAGKLDPLVGMSVLVVILVIMLVWGRLCAIVCTSAWFYFVARSRSQRKNGDGRSSGDVDLNSEEYKKKVVLEGFLERNHRASAL